ncbi:malonate transporter [Pullulanibacillus camelliae]|uniref:Malonate transporter n=1 Tax=Pullulanibacillus camelliae TaxID=1707096 RepID=A0A8J2YHP2_9BACL|nr:AEC family transporter [Pullulanibacillus camelliae]GGE43668.1 malonate transporter [Pullulanibacillus camelliae]
MTGFNQQFIYSVIIIALGYLLKRFNILKEKDGEGLSRIVFNLTLPALIVVTFNDMTLDFSLVLLIISAIVYGGLIASIGLLVYKKETRRIKGMLGMMVPGFNIGLFAYPLVEGIWGQKGLQYFGMFDVGNAFIVFGLIYIIGSFYSNEDVQLDVKFIMLKMLKSIPFMTYMIVCLLNILDWHLPAPVIHVSKLISVANMPMSLLLLGLYLNFSFDKSYNKLILKFMSIRYVIGLALGILLFFILPMGDMFKYTLLLGLILPTSVSVLPYAIELGYDQRFAGTVSNLTILISFFLLWGIGNFII